MANADNPNGFRPVKYLSGVPYSGSHNKYVAAENLFLGDLVELTGADGDGYPTVARAEAGDVMVGAVVGWDAVPSGNGSAALENLYCASGTVVYIADEPNLVFEAQQDSTNIVDATIGLNAEVVVAAGSTTTGKSNMEVDSDTADTTNTLSLRLMGKVDRPDNSFGATTDTNSRLLVTINLHQYANGSTGI
jgi:hypothetical protein